jgi:hypothetical protein
VGRAWKHLAVAAVVLLVGTTVSAQLIDEGWQSNQDGNAYILYGVGTGQINNLAGSGTRCVATDSTGKLIPMSVPCGNGATVYADGIVTGTIQLASVASALLQTGTIAYVNSVDDYFSLQLSSLTADNKTVVTASGLAGYQWVRLGLLSLRSQAQTTWYLDPSGTCNDENAGTSGHALCTFAEAARRLTGTVFDSVALNINLLSSSVANDDAYFNVRLAGTASVNITGTPSAPLYSGTVATYTAQALAAAVDDNELVDNGIPTSFTASGLMADGLLFKRTNSTAVYWWAALDLGSKTLRTSVVTAGASPGSLSPGDTYEVDSLPSIYSITFPPANSAFANPVNFTHVRFATAGSFLFSTQFESTFTRCSWPASPPPNISGQSFSNCSFAAGVNITQTPQAITIINNGLMKGSGNTITTLSPGVFQIGGTTFEGCRLSGGQQAQVLINRRLSFYDTTSVALLARDQANVMIWDSTGTGNHGLGGKNNTGNIAQTLRDSSIIYNEAGDFVAGITSVGSPMIVSLAGYAVSALPIIDINSGDKISTPTTPLSTGIVQSNASGFESIVTIGSGLSYSSGTLSATGGGSVTSVTGSNGVACSPSSPNPNCTLATLACGANTFVSSASSSSGLICTQPTIGNLANIPSDTVVGNNTVSSAAPVAIPFGLGTYIDGSGNLATNYVSVNGSDSTADYLINKVSALPPIYVAAAATYLPPTSGLKAWFRADAGVTGGSSPTAWADQSGNGNNLVVGSASLGFTGSSINGLPGINWNGTASQRMVNTAVNLVTSNAARTVIVVAKPAAAFGNAGTAFDFRLGSQDFGLLMGVSGGNYYYSNGVLVPTISGPPSINGVPTDMEWLYDGANFTVYINGAIQTLSSSSGGSGDTGTTGFEVGNRLSTANQPFNGDINEVLVYDHKLTCCGAGTEMNQARYYIQQASRYNISLGASAPATTETVQVSEQGAIVSGSTSTTAQNLGMLTTGPICGTVSGGVNTLATCGSGSLTCAMLPALTGDITTSAGSCATTLASVISAATYGSGGSYILSETVDAKGRATAFSTVSTPISSTLSWQMNQGSLAIGQNNSTIVLPAGGGVPISLTAAAGTAVSTTLAANYGSSTSSPPTYPFRVAWQSVVCAVDVGASVTTGTGSATLQFDLWGVVTNPATPANWTQLGNTTGLSISGGATSFQALGFTVSSIPVNTSLTLLARRTDVNSLLTITTLAFQAVCTMGQ